MGAGGRAGGRRLAVGLGAPHEVRLARAELAAQDLPLVVLVAAARCVVRDEGAAITDASKALPAALCCPAVREELEGQPTVRVRVLGVVGVQVGQQRERRGEPPKLGAAVSSSLIICPLSFLLVPASCSTPRTPILDALWMPTLRLRRSWRRCN